MIFKECKYERALNSWRIILAMITSDLGLILLISYTTDPPSQYSITT